MIFLDIHIWVNWILGGEAALTPAIVAAMQKENRFAVSGVESLPITCEIANRAVTLPEIHRDPSDRIIIATALVHEAKLASLDSVFPSYPELQNLLVGK